MNDRPSVFWDDLNEDMQSPRYRIAYGYDRKRIGWTDIAVNLLLRLATFAKRLRS